MKPQQDVGFQKRVQKKNQELEVPFRNCRTRSALRSPFAFYRFGEFQPLLRRRSYARLWIPNYLI
jgi:hypothetical protein